MVRSILIVATVAISATTAQASLIGTELRIGTVSQVSSGSEIFLNDFPASAIVSATEVEFPSADSLFGDLPRPPGSSIVDTSIDAGAAFIEVDFDDAGSGSFAPWLQNSYVFGFSSDALVTITGAQVDREVTTLGIADGNVSFDGGDLFVNVTGLRFDPGSFLRIDLASEVGPGPGEPGPEGPGPSPIPVPASLPLLALALGGLTAFSRRGR